MHQEIQPEMQPAFEFPGTHKKLHLVHIKYHSRFMKISSNDSIFKEDFCDCTSPSSCLRNSEVKLTRLLDTLVFILCRLPSVIAPTSPPGVAVTPFDRVTITVPDAEVANQSSNVAGLVTNSILLC